ncbi:hypothetical protein ACH5RR_037079 [Cinchona calisaya]|uniref:Uncharacterized protein n=1 Tax=Cinchona calisaya TaxID=153742 RepID=A0ABD2Y9Y1_9GENT
MQEWIEFNLANFERGKTRGAIETGTLELTNHLSTHLDTTTIQISFALASSKDRTRSCVVATNHQGNFLATWASRFNIKRKSWVLDAEGIRTSLIKATVEGWDRLMILLKL